jgi:hypothetical protein
MSETEAIELAKQFIELAKPIWNAIVDIAKKVIKAVKEILKNIFIGIVKKLNDKEACKCLHIWLYTKNRRIRKKQSKRLNKIILSYMPF